MAKAKYAPMFETVSGALNKINKKSPHAADQKMVLATHRVAPTQTQGGCSRVYLRDLESVSRSTPLTSKELDIRDRFTAVSQAVSARKKDPTKIAADQVAFKAQKDQPNGKKTMTAYLWQVEGETYDAAHPRS